MGCRIRRIEVCAKPGERQLMNMSDDDHGIKKESTQTFSISAFQESSEILHIICVVGLMRLESPVLAPDDLFWRRVYRPALCSNYPRHLVPESPSCWLFAGTCCSCSDDCCSCSVICRLDVEMFLLFCCLLTVLGLREKKPFDGISIRKVDQKKFYQKN
jgi:hypothetical protein